MFDFWKKKDHPSGDSSISDNDDPKEVWMRAQLNYRNVHNAFSHAATAKHVADSHFAIAEMNLHTAEKYMHEKMQAYYATMNKGGDDD
jgi:hypothetical protein